MTREASLLPPFVSPRKTSRWPVRLLIATIAVAWVAVGIDLREVWDLIGALRGIEVDAGMRQAQFETMGWMFWIQGTLSLAAGIAFLAWLYQARINIRALGMRRMRYSRNWCFWAFIIPVMNAFRPYQVMREIWKASSPQSLDPFQWQSLPTPGLVVFWWMTVLAAGGLRTLTVMTSLGTDVNLQKLVLSGSLNLLADIALGLAAGVSIFIVTRLTEAQETKWELQSRAAENGSEATAAV